MKFLKTIQDTFKDNNYCNVVGSESALLNFVEKAKNSNIWTYRVYTVCVYKGRKYKGIFCKKEDTDKIKELIKGENLVLNAQNPF